MKNRKILIISIVFVFIVVLGTLGILYFTTDLFKTEQELFYKYLAQTKIANINVIEKYNMVNNKIMQNSNSSVASLDFSTLTQNQATGNKELQKIASIKSNGLKNVLTNQSYRDLTLLVNNQELGAVKYIKDGNIYGVMSDEIVTKYLAIENSNLKDFFTKLGVTDTENIPDSIPITNYKEILKIDEEILKQLKENYSALIYNNINEEKFYKINNKDKTETIGVSLTEEEVKDLILLVLENIKNDTILLNLIIEKANELKIEGITIENLQSGLKEYIDEAKQETTNEEDGWAWDWSSEHQYAYEKQTNSVIKILLIKKENKIIGINFENHYTKQTKIYENAAKAKFELTEEAMVDRIRLDFSKDDNIDIYIEGDNEEKSKVKISCLDNSDEVNIIVTFEYKEDDITQSIKMQHQMNNMRTDNITQKFNIEINIDEEQYKVEFTNNIIFKQDLQISRLTKENSIKLNDLTAEQLTRLFEAIENRTEQVYEEREETIFGESDKMLSQSALNVSEDYEKQQDIQNYISDMESIAENENNTNNN